MLKGRGWLFLSIVSVGLAVVSAAPPATPAKPATQPAALAPGWEEIDQRLVFLTVQLSTVESAIDASNRALKAGGYKLASQQEAAEKARKGNELMDRNGGGPVRWQDFYGRTAERFFYHPTDRNTVHVDPLPIGQRPPQFDYIYRANEMARQKAEDDASKIGTKIDDLLEYRKGLENQQSALWAKVAFRGATSLDIGTRPIYRLDLAAAGTDDAAKQQVDAVKASATFLRAIDAEIAAAQKGLDADQKGVFDHLLQVTTDSRAEMSKQLTGLTSLADPLRDPKTAIGQVSRSAKRLEDSAQNLVDAYKLAQDAETGGDVVAKFNYRGQLQQMIFDYAITTATLDQSLTKAANDWKIKPGATKTPEPVATKVDPTDIAGKLEAAKAARDRNVAAAKRQLVAAIDVQVNAAADAGDLKQVKALQAAMDVASKDGSLPEGTTDPKILAAREQMTKAIAAANGQLAEAYTEAVKAYTKARRLSEAQATQDELAASGLVSTGVPGGGAEDPATTAKPGGTAASGPVGPFVPPQLAKGATVVELPGPVEGAAVGGSGRYLVFHIKKLQQLAIFDVSQAKVTKFVAVPSNDITFTAGDKKLFVGVRDLKKLQRWDLATGNLELTAPAPQGGVHSIAMGACSTGPLILSGGVGGGQDRESKRFWQLSPTNFKADPMPSEHWDDWRGPEHVSVSFDGSTAVSSGGYWAGAELYRINGGKVVSHSSGTYVQGEATIAGNGSLVFRDKGGIPVRGDLTTEFKGIEGEPFAACDAAFSLSLQASRDRKKPSSLNVFANGDPRTLVTLREVPELGKESKLRPWERVFLIPAAKCLVTVGEGSDNLVLRQFDMARELEAEGVDYLFVESTPPTTADLGGKYNYKVVVRSKKGGVKLELQSAPKGMTLSKEGVITWGVPRRLDDKTPTVIVAVTDASGQSVFHSFTINCNEATTKK